MYSAFAKLYFVSLLCGTTTVGVSKEIERFRLPGLELNGGLVVHQTLGERGDEHLDVRLGTQTWSAIFGVLL